MSPTGLSTIRSLPQTRLPAATILLVDDERAVREVTREVLEIGGYRVLEADGPAEATHIAGDQSIEIDLLLTDVTMPGMSGLELARQVQMSRPELVMLFMTGYAENDGLCLASHGLGQEYIQKPFTVHGLLARVADALATRWSSSDGKRNRRNPSP